MTFLRITSDWHLNFYENNGIRDSYDVLEKTDNEDCQVLLLAGDIITYQEILSEEFDELFEQLSQRFKKVYVILGNHEYYHCTYSEVFELFDEYYKKFDITLLENDTIFLDDDTALFGATLWSSFFEDDANAKIFARTQMNDYRFIYRTIGRTITPDDTIHEFKNTLQSLYEFNKIKVKNKVVMTHHAPSFHSVSDTYKGSLLNGAFASSLEEDILNHGYDLWLHGHMHNNSDYFIANTRIIANPLGYPKENYKYNPRLIVDI